jgi:Zn-dependent peptidase ImmA (M78 family)/transcriptional regulator with XRE-family HTH domain
LGYSQPADTIGAMSEIADRIRSLIRSEQGLTQKSLALAVGMKPDALSRALSGERGLSIDELFAIAGHFRVSVHELATGQSDPHEVAVAARHGFDNDTKAYTNPAWDSSKPVLEDIALAYRQAADSARTSAPKDIGRLPASALRTSLVGANGPDFVRTFADAIERSFDIDVVRVGGLTNSYSMRIGERVVIVTSDTSNWFYQNFSLAHELGHIASGTMRSLDDDHRPVGRHEAGANKFASELLLPRELVASIEWRSADRDVLGRFLWSTGVSTKSLANRLAALGFPVSADVERALAEKTQRVLSQSTIFSGVSSAELVAARSQDSSARRFPPHLIAAHRGLVERGLLHAKTLAWMLGNDEIEIERESSAATHDVSVDELQAFLGLPEQ